MQQASRSAKFRIISANGDFPRWRTEIDRKEGDCYLQNSTSTNSLSSITFWKLSLVSTRTLSSVLTSSSAATRANPATNSINPSTLIVYVCVFRSPVVDSSEPTARLSCPCLFGEGKHRKKEIFGIWIQYLPTLFLFCSFAVFFWCQKRKKQLPVRVFPMN